jgi:hypothetical protein
MYRMAKLQEKRLHYGRKMIGFHVDIVLADSCIRIFALEETFFLLIFAIEKQKDGIRFDASAETKTNNKQ